MLVKKAIQGGARNPQQFGGILLISIRLGQGSGNIGRFKLVSLFYRELKGVGNVQMRRQVTGFNTTSPVIDQGKLNHILKFTDVAWPMIGG